MKYFLPVVELTVNKIKYLFSGYSPDKYSMWRELCSKTREKLTDPYLRAAFAFLTSETESHDAVLVNIKLPKLFFFQFENQYFSE